MAVIPIGNSHPWYQIKENSPAANFLFLIPKVSFVAIGLLTVILACLPDPLSIDHRIVAYAGLGLTALSFILDATLQICIERREHGNPEAFELFPITPHCLMLTTLSVVIFAWAAFGNMPPLVGTGYALITHGFVLIGAAGGLIGISLYFGCKYLIEN